MIGSLAWMLHFGSSRWSLCTGTEAAATLPVRESLRLSINPHQKRKLFRRSSQKLLFKVKPRQRSRQAQLLRRGLCPLFFEPLQSSKGHPLPISRKIAKYNSQKNENHNPFRKELRPPPRTMVLLSRLKVSCQVVTVAR